MKIMVNNFGHEIKIEPEQPKPELIIIEEPEIVQEPEADEELTIILHCHVGDLWIILNHLIHIKQKVVYCAERTYQLANEFNRLLGNKLIIKLEEKSLEYMKVYEGDNHIRTSNARVIVREARKHFSRTVNYWTEGKRKRNKVCYSKGWISGKGLKEVDGIENIEKLLSEVYDEIVCVDAPMTFEEGVNHLAECDLCICNDNAWGHIAHSVGCPKIILTGPKNLGRARKWQRKQTIITSMDELGNFLDKHKNKIELPSISFCTTCMNRVHHLKQTLPENIDVLASLGVDYEICLVNWGSKDDLHEWIMRDYSHLIENGKMKYLKLEKEFFEMAPAKNAAHDLATKEFVCNLDADNIIIDEWTNFIINMIKKYDDVVIVGGETDNSGRILMNKIIFDRLGGYDETYKTYGYDDTDIKERAKLENHRMIYGADQFCRAIGHDNDSRYENMNVKNKRRSFRRNKRYYHNKIMNMKENKSYIFETTIMVTLSASDKLYNFNIYKHFFDYYIKMKQVREILLIINYDTEDQYNNILKLIKEYNNEKIKIIHKWQGLFHNESRMKLEEKYQYLVTTEFITFLDSDEFVNITNIKIDHSDIYIGHFSDRLSINGNLKNIEYPDSIFSQFPKEISIQKNIMNANNRKVILSRRGILLSTGHHHAIKEKKYKVSNEYYKIDHFKFDSLLIEREKHKIYYHQFEKHDFSNEQKKLLSIIEDNKITGL